MQATTLLLILFLSSTLLLTHADHIQGTWVGQETHSGATWTLIFKNGFGNSTDGTIFYYSAYTVDEQASVYTLDGKIILPKVYAGQVIKAIYRVNEFGFLNFGCNEPGGSRPESFGEASFYLVASKK